jgi:hypothetical protein
MEIIWRSQSKIKIQNKKAKFDKMYFEKICFTYCKSQLKKEFHFKIVFYLNLLFYSLFFKKEWAVVSDSVPVSSKNS